LLSLALLLAAAVALPGCSTMGDMVTGASMASTPTQARTVRLMVASTRAGETAGPVKYSVSSVSIPPGHEAGAIERPSFGGESRSRHVVITSDRRLDPDSFRQEVATQLSGRVGTSRDILVFVHGFNVNYDEARWRLAQIVTDSGFTGVPVLFTWPSRNKILAYGSDRETATASRDQLEQLLQDLGATPGVGRVHVMAHSMGTWLAMEALRQSAIAGKADLGGHIGEVMLAAPDIDLDVFRAQMQRLGRVARVSVFASADDRALSVSRTLAGDRARLGALDLKNREHVDELVALNVRVYDLSQATGGSDIFRHGTFAEAPAVVRSIGAQLSEPQLRDGTAGGQAQSFVDPAALAGATPAEPPAAPAAVVSAPLPAPDAGPARQY
jgi:esterase/lipase superfamily enzyme